MQLTHFLFKDFSCSMLVVLSVHLQEVVLKSRAKFIRKLARRVWPPLPPSSGLPLSAQASQGEQFAAFEGYTFKAAFERDSFCRRLQLESISPSTIRH